MLVNLLLWNTRGLSDPKKLRQLLVYLEAARTDIALLTETHHTHQHTLTSLKIQHCISHTARTGTTLLVLNSAIQLLHAYPDPEGRYIEAVLQVNKRQLRLKLVYAPATPATREDWLRTWLRPLHLEGIDILAGDFNCVTRPEDRTSVPTHTRDAEILTSATQELSLTDVALHLSHRPQHTYFSQAVAGYSARLDRLYASPDLLQTSSSLEVLQAPLPFDHMPVRWSVKLDTPHNTKRTMWKLDSCTLRDPEAVARVSHQIAEASVLTTQPDPLATWLRVKCAAIATLKLEQQRLHTERNYHLLRLRALLASSPRSTLEHNASATTSSRTTPPHPHNQNSPRTSPRLGSSQPAPLTTAHCTLNPVADELAHLLRTESDKRLSQNTLTQELHGHVPSRYLTALLHARAKSRATEEVLDLAGNLCTTQHSISAAFHIYFQAQFAENPWDSTALTELLSDWDPPHRPRGQHS
jgi:exonuclease III